jgi:hypothetical protein
MEFNSETRMNSIIRVILEGVYDNESPLSALRGTPHIVRNIWEMIVEYYKHLIQIGEIPVKPKHKSMMAGATKKVITYFMPMQTIKFPPKSGLNQKQNVKKKITQKINNF